VNQTPVEKSRDVIPRWRPVALTAALGELSPAIRHNSKRRSAEFNARAHNRNLEAWIANPSLKNAAELVQSSIVVSKQTDSLEAARLLVRDDSTAVPHVRRLAQSVLATQDDNLNAEARPIGRKEVAAQRSLASFAPRNAIGWTELARAHSANGNFKKAEDALKVARALAPDHRHILRATACFYSNAGDPERANHILNRSAATPGDPWLAAAEVATASAAGLPSKTAKRAKETILRGEYRNRDMAEVASAVATLELKNGCIARAKKIFRFSMAEPTENAVAQAVWANKEKQLPLVVSEDQLRTPRAFEASARTAYDTLNWQECLVALHSWTTDQPFSAGPSIIASYIACEMTNDPVTALTFTDLGRAISPRDTTIHNNRAVACARLGRLAEAKAAWQKSSMYSDKTNEGQQIVIRATRGLIDFCAGRPAEGEKHYMDAIDAAMACKSKYYVARVLLFFGEALATYDPSSSVSVLEGLVPLQTYDEGRHFGALFESVTHRIRNATENHAMRNRSFGAPSFQSLDNLAVLGSRLLTIA
jgi:tetratricopeptide (TPR) repeat protein